MSELFNAVKKYDNGTVTENGCAAYKSTLSACLDLFFNACSCRADNGRTSQLVRDAFNEDKLTCMRLLFYIRDVRGGQGERNVFRVGMKELAKFAPKDIKNVLAHVPFFGRWDDLLALVGINSRLDEEIGNIVMEQANKDLKAFDEKRDHEISLLWKWLPSENASSKETINLAKKVRKDFFKTSSKSYRKLLSKMRKVLRIVERDISSKEYKLINYSALPSKAAQKYKAAFFRNDGERYTKYIEDLSQAVQEGRKDVKINTSTLYPYEIVKDLVASVVDWGGRKFTKEELMLLDATWKSQKDYFTKDSKHENWLVVSDVSGSMYCCDHLPISASISLAMYTAEHNTGVFADKFITFSSRPEFISINRDWTLKQKIETISRAPWGMNTNLEAVFDMILEAAQRYNVAPAEMPSALLIISDMQFDEATCDRTGYNSNPNVTMLRRIREKYATYGYTLPKIIFWNVAGDYKANVPALKNDNGVILFSGYKPGMFDQMVNGTTPEQFMLSVVNSERYSIVKIDE